MRYLLPLSLLLAATAAHGFDTSTQGVVIGSYGTTQLTTAPFDRKLIIDARDDAAAFVASGGRIRGARLQAALMALRQAHPAQSADDLELAQAILVQ
ncbi:DUF2388 domain-containing protein [Pseudomonas cremoricolorata]|uniref:Holliday junction resolvase n=1 Tax=Pseudomonas cremoricolorata TaxID=157783 RepID=A0A089WPA7_9PSED|nr:DUF2388 domain-containing protein [Pseudomonas cremoricolorata]AIR88979.1 Holliday junction resolvase [Pseudomonas cremoricolorata]